MYSPWQWHAYWLECIVSPSEGQYLAALQTAISTMSWQLGRQILREGPVRLHGLADCSDLHRSSCFFHKFVQTAASYYVLAVVICC